MTEEVSIQPPPDFRGGILADSMGLGKSLSVLALCAHTKNLASGWHSRSQPSVSKSTLLIVPLSLLRTWEDQISTHFYPGTLSCWRYHDSKRNIDTLCLAAYDIVLTTYDVVALQWRDCQKGLTPLFSITWSRIILDEGMYAFEPSCTASLNNIST